MKREPVNPVHSVVIGLIDKLGCDRLTIARQLGFSRSFLSALELGKKRIPSESIEQFLELAAKLEDEWLMTNLRRYHAKQLVSKCNQTELDLLWEYFKNEP